MIDTHSKHIIVQNITACYGSTTALEDVSGTLEPGSLTAVFGPNGGGKSTFVKLLASALKPTKGQITHQCHTTCHPAYLPQQASFQKQFPITVREVVAMGLWRKTGGYGAIDACLQADIDKALQRVGLLAYDKRLIATLSGGQFQRMLFARIILEDSSLIILDEPFAAIDLQTSDTLLHLIQEWHKSGKTVVVVLHNLERARTFFPQSILLSRRCLGWGDTQSVLTDEAVRHAYTSFEGAPHV